MTQAILNSSNTINSTNLSEQFGLYATNQSDDNSFVNIIEDKINNKESSNETKVSTLDDLMKEIKKATKEVSEENSLDLTLMKDIDSVIENIQNIPENVQEILPEETTEIISELESGNVTQALTSLTKVCGNNENSLLEFTQNETQDVTLQDEASIDKIVNLLPEEESELNYTESDNMDFELNEEQIKELKIESISSDANFNSESQTAMDGQSPQEYAMKAIISKEMPDFEINMENLSAQKQNIQQETGTQGTEQNKIIEQITKQLNGLQNTSKVNIVLNPESLGKVSVQLVKSSEGMSAQFTVATQDAKEIIMKGLDGLKETLLSHGVGVDNISVKLNDTQKAEYRQDWTEQGNSQGGNKEQAQQNKNQNKEQFAKMMAQILPEENNEILE